MIVIIRTADGIEGTLDVSADLVTSRSNIRRVLIVPIDYSAKGCMVPLPSRRYREYKPTPSDKGKLPIYEEAL